MGSIVYEDEDQVIAEVRDASPAHYLLKIESFSLISESGIDKYESDEFDAGGHKWKMIIYPNGNGSDKGSEHISVYLALCGTSSLPTGWEVNAIFTFFLFNQLLDNYLAVRGKMRRFHPIKSEWGLPKFLPHKKFKEPSNGYLVEDKCAFGVEIFVIHRQALVERLSLTKLNNSFKREWKIQNFSNLGEHWLSEEFTVGDHKWKLWLYPKGNQQTRGNNISIFLLSVDSKGFDHHQKVKANYRICIKDQINGECDNKILSYSIWFATTRQNWGTPCFMPLTQLHDQKKGYIVNDCIVVEVEVEVLFKYGVKKS